jgi:hypothetical protein
MSDINESPTNPKTEYDKKKEYIISYYKRRYENDSLFRQKENKRIAERNKINAENPEYKKKINQRNQERRLEAKEAVEKLKKLEIVLKDIGISVK